MKLARCGSWVCGLVLIAFVARTAAAEDKVVTFGVSADYFSKYIWRGQVLDNKSVLQPTVSANAYGFTGSIWGNMELTDSSKIVPDNAWEFSEYDYTLDYTSMIPGTDWLSGSVGVIYYVFPNQVYDPTTEIYGGLSLPKVPLTPSFKWYRDVDVVEGSYFQFGIGHTLEKIYVVNDTCYCNLQLGASYGWGNKAYNTGYALSDDDGSNDLTLTAGLPICIGSWTVKPSLSYSTMLSDSIRENTDESENIWVGVGISTSF